MRVLDSGVLSVEDASFLRDGRVRGAVKRGLGGGDSTITAMPGLFLAQLACAGAVFLAWLGSSVQRLCGEGAAASFFEGFLLRVSDFFER